MEVEAIELSELIANGERIDSQVNVANQVASDLEGNIRNYKAELAEAEANRDANKVQQLNGEIDDLEGKNDTDRKAQVETQQEKQIQNKEIIEKVLTDLRLNEVKKLANLIDVKDIKFEDWDQTEFKTKEDYAKHQIMRQLAEKCDSILGGAHDLYRKFGKTPEELIGAKRSMMKEFKRGFKDFIYGTKMRGEEGFWHGVITRVIVSTYLLTSAITGGILASGGESLLTHHGSLQNIADGVQGCYEWNLTTGEVYKIGTCGYAYVSNFCCMPATTANTANTLCENDSQCYGPSPDKCNQYPTSSSATCVDSTNDGNWDDGDKQGRIYTGDQEIRCIDRPNSTNKKYCLQYCDNDINNPNLTNSCKPCPPRDGNVPYSQMRVKSFDPDPKDPGSPDPSKRQNPYLSICKNEFPFSVCSFANQLCKPEVYSLKSSQNLDKSNTWLSGGCYNCKDPNLSEDKKKATDKFPHGQCANPNSTDKDATKYVQFPVCVSADDVFHTIYQLAYLKPIWAPDTKKKSIWSWSLLIISIVTFILIVIWYILYLIRHAAERYK
jgi:hypothetical protein